MDDPSLNSLIIRGHKNISDRYVMFTKGKNPPNNVKLSKSVLNDCDRLLTFSVFISMKDTIYVVLNPKRQEPMFIISKELTNEFKAFDGYEVVNDINRLLPFSKVLTLPLHKIYRDHENVVYLINGNWYDIKEYPKMPDFNDVNFKCPFKPKRL